jgi:hypothetical protein
MVNDESINAREIPGEPDWQAMVVDHLKLKAGPATFGA